MSKIIDISNQKFGHLLAIAPVNIKNSNHANWLCLCDCGNSHITSSYSLRKGYTKSCGCQRKGRKCNYNLTTKNKRLYNIWVLMRHRCYKDYVKCYKNYGAKGITICDEWRDNFRNFQEWALSHGYDNHLSIDRIDNNKGYSPDNCKWSTIHDQQQNKSNCIYFTHNGETHNMSEWCNILGLSYQTIRTRRRKIINNQNSVSFEDIFY